MTTFIALLRGINVGKANRVPMAELRALLSRLGYAGVATLLNSGNAVFQAPGGTPVAHAEAIARALAGQMQVEVPVIVVTAQELASIVAACPLGAGTGHADGAEATRTRHFPLSRHAGEGRGEGVSASANLTFRCLTRPSPSGASVGPSLSCKRARG